MKVQLFSNMTCGKLRNITFYYHLIQGLNKIGEGDEEERSQCF